MSPALRQCCEAAWRGEGHPGSCVSWLSSFTLGGSPLSLSAPTPEICLRGSCWHVETCPGVPTPGGLNSRQSLYTRGQCVRKSPCLSAPHLPWFVGNVLFKEEPPFGSPSAQPCLLGLGPLEHLLRVRIFP